MKKSRIIEAIVFIIMLSVLSFVGVKAFKHTFDIGTTYHIAFKDIDGIVIGSPVRILGVDIGHVTKIQNSFDEIYIDFVVTNNKVKLPQGTRATIAFFGIAGSRSIELTPPDGESKGEAIVIDEPIRLGHAFDIMAKFLRATMISIGGLSEMTEGKTQEDVDNMVATFLKNTNKADDHIGNLTSVIETGGAKLHKSFEGTTVGMTRFTNDIEGLNISQNFNIAKYAVNSSRRYLLQFHRNIKTAHKHLPEYTQNTAVLLDKANKIPEQIKAFDKFSQSMCEFEKTLDEWDKNTSQENLDKIYNSFENVKFFSENLSNYI